VSEPARFLGLTWDHPRGYRALEAAMARETHPPIVWRRQPLEGFESHPIADLAAQNDLLVLDHPHLGEAVATNCLLPLERFFEPSEIEEWNRGSIGSAMASYRWAGEHYALPLDVAAQVMARDPQISADAAPDTWDDVVRLAETRAVAPSLAGPHAIVTFFSICLSIDSALALDELVDDGVGVAAVEILRRLAARAPSGSVNLNPIGLLEALAKGDELALVPLVFGYVNYSKPGFRSGRVAFSNAPRMVAAGRRGSVLGGTGIGVTARARPDRALLDHLRWLMSPGAQSGFIPEFEGQPSARAAWRSPEVNAPVADFYQGTAETIEHAWVRPRFDGYVAFQNAASEALRNGLAKGDDDRKIVTTLKSLWSRARAQARGPLSA
jgi:multiple sugar transport system substrate-binding protein